MNGNSNNNASSLFRSLVFAVIVLVLSGFVLAEYLSARREIRLMRQQAQQMGQQIMDQSAAIEQLKQENQRLSGELAAAQLRNEQANQSILSCDSQLAAVTGERDALLAQVGALTQQQEDLAVQFIAMTAERNSLLQQVGILTGERDGLRQQVADLMIDRDAQLKLTDRWMSESIVLRNMLQTTTVQPYATPAPDVTKLPNWKVVGRYPWWLGILLIYISYIGYDIHQRNFGRPTRARRDKKIQLWLTREQMHRYITYLRKNPQARK